MIIPLRIFWEVIEALEDVLIFASPRLRLKKTLRTISDAVRMISEMGSFDMVEVEARNDIKINVCLR